MLTDDYLQHYLRLTPTITVLNAVSTIFVTNPRIFFGRTCLSMVGSTGSLLALKF
jgi:hypothetical protein